MTGRGGETLPGRESFELRLTVADGGPSLSALRTRIAEALPELAEDVVADVQLVATELVTNAHLHGESPVTFRLLASPEQGRLRVEMFDSGPGEPTMRRPGSTQSHGRGLLLVDGYSLGWGSTPEPVGKTVWAEFAMFTPQR
jgi:hypothetical protein